MLRLFVALELHPDLRAELTALQRQLRAADQADELRWTNVSGIHLTLVFLGEVATTRVDEIGAAISGAVEAAPAPCLAIGDLGAFPSCSGPRVLWVGVVESGDRLVPLQRAIEAALVPLGWPAAARPFQPHVTLARRREARGRPAPLGTGLAALLAGPAVVRRSSPVARPHATVGLFRSDPTPSGTRYEALRRWELRPE